MITSMSPLPLILIASILATIVGMLWYSPLMFGRMWARLRGLHFESKKEYQAYQRSMALLYLGAFVATTLISLTLWALLGLMGISKVDGALLLATILWGGFIIPATFSAALFDKKSLKLWALDAGCAYVSMLVMAIVLMLLR